MFAKEKMPGIENLKELWIEEKEQEDREVVGYANTSPECF